MGCRVSHVRGRVLTHDHLLVMLQAALERVDERVDDHAHALRRDGQQRLEPAQVEGHVLLGRVRQLSIARLTALAQSCRRLRCTNRRCHTPEMLPLSLALAPDMRRCEVEPRRYVGCTVAPCDWRRCALCDPPAWCTDADERRSAPASGLIVVIGSMARAQRRKVEQRADVVGCASRVYSSPCGQGHRQCASNTGASAGR